MQCLPSARFFPNDTFGQPHRSGSDPLRFSLNLSVSDSRYSSSCRSPYLSPPMSGSPPPEFRSDLSHGLRHAGRPSSPAPNLKYPESHHDYQGHHMAGGQGIDRAVHDPRQSQMSNQQYGLPSVNDIRPPHLLPAFGAPNTISTRTTTLPPRSTRRAKAHVASACVNCKRKHLGCDSARPCRRCVVAGKEESCVDVTHKRRGRPPLKAEEGPIRTYESTFGQPGILRVSQHPSASLGPARGHKRNPSSREIRPSTDFNHAHGGPSNEGERRIGSSPTTAMQPPMWTPPILPSPSPFTTGNVPARRPASSGQQPTPQAPTHDYQTRECQLQRPMGRLSPMHSFPGEGPRASCSPHMAYKPRSPTDSSSFSSPGPSGSWPASYQPSDQGLASFKLPPILGRSSDIPPPKEVAQPRRFPSLPWLETEQRHHPTASDRTVSTSDSSNPLSPFRRGSVLSNSTHVSPTSPVSLPPLRTTGLQKAPADQLQTPIEDSQKEEDNRPAKRLRMELGEMVND
ncbi:Zn(2)-C6 fungal-type domain-containing protein [Trichophyton interdigitale]|nr:Zn(2)-C6 fungal-type domain-containing protein [Trichophyton interdigitale]